MLPLKLNHSKPALMHSRVYILEPARLSSLTQGHSAPEDGPAKPECGGSGLNQPSHVMPLSDSPALSASAKLCDTNNLDVLSKILHPESARRPLSTAAFALSVLEETFLSYPCSLFPSALFFWQRPRDLNLPR